MALGEEKSDDEELVEKSDVEVQKSELEVLVEDPSIINLAKRMIEDPNLSHLSRVTVELFDSLNRCDAENHFKAVNTTSRDGTFFKLLCEEFDKSLRLINNFSHRMNETRNDLFELQGECVRVDPILPSVLKSREPDVRMRGALSILIGYWCLEFKLEDYFTGDLGLYGLGIETISFAKSDCESQEGTKTEAEDPTAFTTLERRSPIEQLINVPSISRLADKIIKNYPGIVKVAEELLNSFVPVAQDPIVSTTRSILVSV